MNQSVLSFKVYTTILRNCLLSTETATSQTEPFSPDTQRFDRPDTQRFGKPVKQRDSPALAKAFAFDNFSEMVINDILMNRSWM